MIDMLVLRCSSKKLPVGFGIKLEQLGIPLEISIDKDGCVSRTRHPWDSIPSSYSQMAFKVFDFSLDGSESFFIEIKASPAKLMQGHNVYGSLNFIDCSMNLIELLCLAYPVLFKFLDFSTWSLVQIDITYSSRAKDNHEALAFFKALRSVSYGQTKPRAGYDSTLYFGQSNSRLKKIKVYHKSSEVQQVIRKLKGKPNADFLAQVYEPRLIDFADGLIRWEVSLFHRYFKRLGVSVRLGDIFQFHTFSPDKLRSYWVMGIDDLFKALEGQSMKVLNDTNVKTDLRAKFSKISDKTGKVSTIAPDSAFKTYFDIRRDGWEVVRKSMHISTFNRHVKMLCACGLSRAALQNMNGLDDGSHIVSFSDFMKVDFDAQYPNWCELPNPRFTRDMFFNFAEFDFLGGMKHIFNDIKFFGFS